MSSSKESDAGFPWFEKQNFTGWLVQFRGHLRKAGANVVLIGLVLLTWMHREILSL